MNCSDGFKSRYEAVINDNSSSAGGVGRAESCGASTENTRGSRSGGTGC